MLAELLSRSSKCTANQGTMLCAVFFKIHVVKLLHQEYRPAVIATVFYDPLAVDRDHSVKLRDRKIHRAFI